MSVDFGVRSMLKQQKKKKTEKKDARQGEHKKYTQEIYNNQRVTRHKKQTIDTHNTRNQTTQKKHTQTKKTNR